jgi:hypothetical protein
MFSLVMECGKECAEKEKQLEQRDQAETPVSFQQQRLAAAAGWRSAQHSTAQPHLPGWLAGWLSS